MTQLSALQPNKKGIGEGLSPAVSSASALDLIAALDQIPVVGRQMFERDCLSFTFDSWRRFHSGENIPENERITSEDVLADIADIRALPSRHSDVSEVDADLLEIAGKIEAFIKERSPTVQ